MDFAVSANHRVKLKESEKRDKDLDVARELKKKLWNMMTLIPIVIGTLSTITNRIGTRIGGLGNKRTSGDHPNYSIIRILRKVRET